MFPFDKVEKLLGSAPAGSLELFNVVKGQCKEATPGEGFQRAAEFIPGADNQGQLLLYSQQQESTRALQDFLEAYGEFILFKAGAEAQDIWKRKLTFVDDDFGVNFDAKLSSKQYSTYRALVESYTGAVDRLVALHFANALIANGISIGDAFNIKTAEHPATSGMATLQTPYSLLPLLGAYCDKSTCDCFGLAFRRRTEGTLTCGRKDVLDGLNNIIDSICANT